MAYGDICIFYLRRLWNDKQTSNLTKSNQIHFSFLQNGILFNKFALYAYTVQQQ